MNGWRASPLFLAIVLCWAPPNARAQAIWITPRQGPDFLSMFEENAPWQSVSAHVSVVTLSIESVLRLSDQDLQKTFADLKRRRIQLAVQFMALSGRPNPDAPDCGVAVEGYSAAGEPLQVARKVKRLGGEINFLGMDEPLFFGHQFDRYEGSNPNPKRRGCHLSIQEVAADAAERIQMVRSVFPDVKVGEAEPLMAFADSTWREDLSNWFDAFQSATGRKLAFFRLDLHWRQPWRVRLPQLMDLLEKKGIPLGIIYDGSSPNDDDAWVREAGQRFKEFEGEAHLKPESVHFVSWTPSPSRTLPETDPRTMTGLVNTYLAWKQQGGEPSGSAVPEIWLGKVASKLFSEPDMALPDVLNHVPVVAAGTAAIANAPDTKLTRILPRLNEHHIALALEAYSQGYLENPPACGGGVEGYAFPAESAAVAVKLKRNGGVLKYINMDEPLWFGHYYDGKHACRSSIENVAERVARNLREFRKVFPDIVVGDTIPAGISDRPGWQSDYRKWMAAYRAATGQPLAFVMVDIDWGRATWPQSLRATVNFLRDEHMPFGIIYNTVGQHTNEQWLEDARVKFTRIEKEMLIVPNKAFFNSWDKFPPRGFTDQSGLGEDYLVQRYLSLHGTTR